MREWGNAALHVIVGYALLVAALWNPWLAGPSAFVWGFLREQQYVAGQLNQEILSDWPTFRELWIDWISWHKLWEAAQWGIGGALAGLTAQLLF